MLLEFKMKNFKSFKEELNFKMTPAPIKDLEYSLISKENNEKEIKALSSAVIYGPNSAGKTNIIGGMEVFRSIILNGNIKNREDRTTANIAVSKLELIPNINNKENEPVMFYIKIYINGMIVEFKLVLNLESFLINKNNRKIIEEELKINNKLIYKRTDKVEFGKLYEFKKYFIENFAETTANRISQSNLDDKELFLNGIFKTLYSKKIYDMIIQWFQEKFKIIYRADNIEITPVIPQSDKNKNFFIDKALNKGLKEFGLTSDNIAFPITDNEEQIIPLSMLGVNKEVKSVALPAELFESFGTIRFLNIFPIIIEAIDNGMVLVVDELDASIHPMAIMNIINIFHNNEINTKGAQLIFNTHNPIFLNNALLRRDEIKFVEKEDKGSVHYSLSDFGTNGNKGVRNTEDYMKNYFINKYGAIKDIDFSDIFINEKGNVNIEENM